MIGNRCIRKIMKIIAWYILDVIAYFQFVDATELILNDTDSIKISILPESEGPIEILDSDKPLLRYGFHRTQDCQNFEKAFICVRKCLDLDYQIAHADKNCICTCYKNTVLAKYKPPMTGSTKWKLGAPTTSMPQWAGGRPELKSDDYEIDANYTEFIEDVTEHNGELSDGPFPAPNEGETLAAEEAEGEISAGEVASDEKETAAEEETPEEGETPAEGESAAEEEHPAEETAAEETAAEETAAEAPAEE